jgi:hypothetical protein
MYALAFSDVMNVKCSFMLSLFWDYRGQMHIYDIACSAVTDVICIFMFITFTGSRHKMYALSLFRGYECLIYIFCFQFLGVRYSFMLLLCSVL